MSEDRVALLAKQLDELRVQLRRRTVWLCVLVIVASSIAAMAGSRLPRDRLVVSDGEYESELSASGLVVRSAEAEARFEASGLRFRTETDSYARLSVDRGGAHLALQALGDVGGSALLSTWELGTNSTFRGKQVSTTFEAVDHARLQVQAAGQMTRLFVSDEQATATLGFDGARVGATVDETRAELILRSPDGSHAMATVDSDDVHVDWGVGEHPRQTYHPPATER